MHFAQVNHKGESSVKLYDSLASRSNITTHQDNDDDDVWSKLGGKKDDYFIYDRCGRLTYYLSLPYSDIVRYPNITYRAVVSAYRDQPCGPCDGDDHAQQTRTTPNQDVESETADESAEVTDDEDADGDDEVTMAMTESEDTTGDDHKESKEIQETSDNGEETTMVSMNTGAMDHSEHRGMVMGTTTEGEGDDPQPAVPVQAVVLSEGGEADSFFKRVATFFKDMFSSQSSSNDEVR